MILWENVLLALNGLWANKMRALLTMLGIIIGIASVIAIMTVGDSLTLSISDQMQSIGANNIQVLLKQKTDSEDADNLGALFGTAYVTGNLSEEDYFTSEMIKDFCEKCEDSVYAISISNQVGSGQINDGKKYANVSVIGGSPGYFTTTNFELLAGNFFSEREFNEGRKVALISDKAVNNLYDGDISKALGDQIEIKLSSGEYLTYTVIGVYEYQNGSSMMNMMLSEKEMSTEVYIPLITANNQLRTEGYQFFSVVTKVGVDSVEFAKEIERFFEGYYRNNNDFGAAAFSMESMVGAMTDMLGKVTLAISVVAGIALLVGGIGVMNIMLVSITERTREIGTRKALGANNFSIRVQFIVEAIIICLIGGIIGIIVGLIMGSFASNLLGYSAVPSIKSIVISISFSMAIGIFFGYYPANKAAKMNPIDALRYE